MAPKKKKNQKKVIFEKKTDINETAGASAVPGDSATAEASASAEASATAGASGAAAAVQPNPSTSTEKKNDEPKTELELERQRIMAVLEDHICMVGFILVDYELTFWKMISNEIVDAVRDFAEFRIWRRRFPVSTNTKSLIAFWRVDQRFEELCTQLLTFMRERLPIGMERVGKYYTFMDAEERRLERALNRAKKANLVELKNLKDVPKENCKKLHKKVGYDWVYCHKNTPTVDLTGFIKEWKDEAIMEQFDELCSEMRDVVRWVGSYNNY